MDAASWQAVERKARLAGNGLGPCLEAQHRGRTLSGSFQGTCNPMQPPAPRAASIHRMLGPDSPTGSDPEDPIRRCSPCKGQRPFPTDCALT